MRRNLHLRDCLWAVALVGVLLAWWIDRQRLRSLGNNAVKARDAEREKALVMKDSLIGARNLARHELRMMRQFGLDPLIEGNDWVFEDDE